MKAYYPAICLALACTSAAQRSAPGGPGGVPQERAHPDTNRLAGCYRLDEGTWVRDSLLGRFMPTSLIPRLIRLDTLRLLGWEPLEREGRPLLRVDTGAQGMGGRPFSYWQRDAVGSDSIRIGAPLAEAGAVLRVHPTPGGLIGELTTFTDAIPLDGEASASAHVHLTRIACP